MRKFEVEFVVGFNHGTWELDTVQVEVEECSLECDFETNLYMVAEMALDSKREYNSAVSFYHPMYYREL